MKDDSTDQLVLLAQMMADSDSPESQFSLNRHLPLVVIVTVGLAMASLAIVVTQQWERHVDSTVHQNLEMIYINQIETNLNRLRRNSDILVGYIRSSEFISSDEFTIFTKSLLSNQRSTDFVYMADHPEQSDQEHLTIASDLNKQAILDMLNSPITRHQLENLTGDGDGLFFVVNNLPSDAAFVVYGIYLRDVHHPSGIWIMSGIRDRKLIEIEAESGHQVTVQLADNIGNVISNKPTNLKTGASQNFTESTLDQLKIRLSVQQNTSELENIDYFKWVLIGFSLIFTALLCIQFVFAKRSIRRLANFAVQRANELTSINSELTEEIINRVRFQAELLQKSAEIHDANKKLEEVQNQLIQQEKLASLGQLAAGVAHEINNPVGFINSNLAMLKKYSERSLQLISAMDDIASNIEDPEIHNKIAEKKRSYKFDSLQKNMQLVIEESQEGVERVKQIVQGLKDFSRVDEAEWQWADLHSGIDSTLNIAWNEIKYKAEVHKEYGDLPLVECVPSQINQVILNLLVNSAQAMATSGNIYIRTTTIEDKVKIEVKDDGSGIPAEHLSKIFDPFFTTKEVGKGTGLGLSLSYGIVQKHRGSLIVKSQPGVGTTFTITLPIQQQENNRGAVANG